MTASPKAFLSLEGTMALFCILNWEKKQVVSWTCPPQGSGNEMDTYQAKFKCVQQAFKEDPDLFTNLCIFTNTPPTDKGGISRFN